MPSLPAIPKKRSGGRLKPETKDLITIIIAVLLLITGISISLLKGFAPELVVFILISFSVGLLSFLMIGKIESKEISFAGIKISQVSGGFLIFILLLSGFLGYKKIASNSDTFQADPSNKKLWVDAAGIFEWYNPPLVYAVEEHQQIKMDWFKNDDFQLRILLIQNADSAERVLYFKPKLERLKIFAIALLEKYKNEFDVKKHLRVKICVETQSPTYSFFTTGNAGRNEQPKSIIYLPDASVVPRPKQSIVSFNRGIHESLSTEFQRHWENDATEISIERLLKTMITKSTTRDSLTFQQ